MQLLLDVAEETLLEEDAAVAAEVEEAAVDVVVEGAVKQCP